jgi:lambda family phage portal protein
MGILDFFRPRRVVERSSPVPKVHHKVTVRQYAGATNGEIYADFVASMLSADAEIVVALATLRARARNLERNTSHATRFLQLMEDNIVGDKGFKMVSRTKRANGQLDKAANDSLELAWSDFCREDVTADGMMDMTELGKAVVRAYCRDGEAFIQILYGPQYQGGVAFHMVEADQVDETLNKVDPRTNAEIRMGVEIDETQRPLAYWCLTRHPGDYQFTGRTWMDKYKRVPADRMIHVFAKRRPGQTRGVPPMACIMMDTKMLAGYREAEIVGRRVAASKMGFFTREDEAGPVKGIADEERDDGELIIEASPGQMKALPTGYKFDSFDPQSASIDYAAFEKQIIRSIATGLGPDYVNLGMDLDDVSYSSIRQGVLTERDFYRGFQGFIIFRFMRLAFRAWYKANIGLNEEIAIPPSRFDRFRKGVRFIGRGWQWVDPEKELKAAKIAVDERFTSRTRIMSERGDDFEEVIDEQVQEKDLMEENDLMPVQKNPEKPAAQASEGADDASEG